MAQDNRFFFIGRVGPSLGLCALAVASACRPSGPSHGGAASESSAVVARFNGGTLTKEELAREIGRLPPALRERFDGAEGRREMARSLIDKRLLVAEARRRGLDKDPEIHRQVTELEERLIVQALLAAEEKAAGPVSETEARAFFDSHKKDFEQPERVRAARVLAAVPAGAPASVRAQARARAEKWAQRLRGGEAFAKVAAEGEGAERARAGDLGFLTRGGTDDRPLVDAAFALTEVGKASGVLEFRDGFAVVAVVERRERRIPSFEEVRNDVEGRVAPVRQRKVFDDILALLRRNADVQVDVRSK